MISTRVGKSIHHIIKNKRLKIILDSIIDEKNDIMDEYIDKVKNFLSQEALFDPRIEKYILFLRFLKKELKLKNKSDLKENSVKLFKLYELPQKRNNVFLVFLLYFFMNQKDKKKETEIFKLIYIYYLIIIYRNKLATPLRNKIINIDQLQFHNLSEITTNKALLVLDKTCYFFKKRAEYIYFFPFVLAIGFVLYRFSSNLLGADISGGEGIDYGKILYGGFVFDDSSAVLNRETGSIVSKLNNSTFMNLIWISLILFLIQALKDTFKVSVKESSFFKIFSYVGNIIKKLLNSILYFYFWFLNYFGTTLINLFIYSLIKFKINLTLLLLYVFNFCYLIINFAIVVIYLYVFDLLFQIGFINDYFIIIASVLTMFIMYINFKSNYENFEKFLLGVEDYLAFINTEKTNTKTKKSKK